MSFALDGDNLEAPRSFERGSSSSMNPFPWDEPAKKNGPSTLPGTASAGLGAAVSESQRRESSTKSRRSAAWKGRPERAGHSATLPMTLQFLIVMIASAINDRPQRRLDYVEEASRILKEQAEALTGGKRLPFTASSGGGSPRPGSCSARMSGGGAAGS